MLKRKRVYKIILLFMFISILTGCWDKKELEDRAYVIGLGIDPSKEKGKIKVTMLFANPEVGSIQGGGGSIEQPREIITFDAMDFITAKGTANAIISRDVSYDLLKIIVVSEEFAKDPMFISTMFDTRKDKEIRMDSYLAVSKEKAYQYFLKNKPKMETRPHKYFQFMINHGIENGMIPDSTLFRFYTAIDRNADLFLAMYTSAERKKNAPISGEDNFVASELNATGELDDTQFIGSAVFRNGQMIDTLTGSETRLVNVLDDTTEIKEILANIPDPFSNKEGQQMAIRIIKRKSNKIKMNLHTPKPKIDITIPLQFEIMTNPSMVNLTKNDKNQRIVKESIREHNVDKFKGFLKKTQTELKGSPFPLSIYGRKNFQTMQEFDQYNWIEKYPDADISVKIDAKILDYNSQQKKPSYMED
ncbi:Ger(x)C family spore germination protein [Niallia sp. Krafla_26]|uniref:Ger(x)C family spore germination protein n=1 Tax=Niallia sp. Krafla_26 TaxID=3064703 RepID=UPI003D172A88